MSDLETLTTFIKSQVPAMISLETLLSSIPAVSPDSGGTGELSKCEALTLALREMGFSKFERYDSLDTRGLGAAKPDVVTTCATADIKFDASAAAPIVRPNLVVTIPGKDDSKRVWIMTHLDVVPPGDLGKWASDPWKVFEKDGKIYGRGVEDNQQGLVGSIFASLAFMKTGIVPPRTVKLLFVADEEMGSDYGIKHILEHHKDLFRPSDLIIIPDGGDARGEIIEVAEKNLLWLKMTTKGLQAHGSRPDQGANAHLAGCDLALRLNDLENFFGKRDPLFEPDRSTFQPTRKETNVPNINTIPGLDVFCMDCRILPCYPLETVRKEVARIVAEVEKKYGVTITCSEEQAVESCATPVNAPVVKSLSDAIEKIYGVKAHPVGIGGGTVAAFLRNIGCDAVVWSRMDETAHQPNEYCILENLTGDSCVMAAFILGAN